MRIYQKGALVLSADFEEYAINKLNGRVLGRQRVTIHPCMTVKSEIESDNRMLIISSFILFTPDGTLNFLFLWTTPQISWIFTSHEFNHIMNSY